MTKIRRAILSCYDKTGIVDLARILGESQVEMIATEGTHRALTKAGIECKDISEFTGIREMMNGRVKTLHPKIHAGLLGIRDNKLHVEEMQTYECQWIDLVVVNLRPLNDIARLPGITLEEVIEQVDIGGLAMIRSAAKNYRYVSVVVNPERYSSFVHELRANDGTLTFRTRFRLAQEAFACSAKYDEELGEYLHRCEPPEY